jgi:D-glycerate 3-kinase
MSDPIEDLIAAEKLPPAYRDIAETYWKPLARELARRQAGKRALLVGINGAQGSGKSTMCRFLEHYLAQRQVRAVTLALDDLYLTREQRRQLAEQVHPLFATRGPPGTHAIGLAHEIFNAVHLGRAFEIPRFDKARDDRAPDIRRITGPVHVVLFEGWCVGSKPQPPEDLLEPINQLEREEDPDGTWRAVVNMWLGKDYAEVFDRLDLLVMLKVAGFETVLANRLEQEEKLRASNPDAPQAMDEAGLTRFIQHYERITRHTLEEMPERADFTFEIGPDRAPIRLPKGLA